MNTSYNDGFIVLYAAKASQTLVLILDNFEMASYLFNLPQNSICVGMLNCQNKKEPIELQCSRRILKMFYMIAFWKKFLKPLQNECSKYDAIGININD